MIAMPKGRQENGLPPNPTGKGGFGDNPENINRSGQSSEARKAAYRAGEKAAKAKEKLVDALLAEIESREGVPADVLEVLTPQVNALVKEALDRAYGQSRAALDLSSEDGSMTPKGHSDAVLAALQAKHGKSDAG